MKPKRTAMQLALHGSAVEGENVSTRGESRIKLTKEWKEYEHKILFVFIVRNNNVPVYGNVIGFLWQ